MKVDCSDGIVELRPNAPRDVSGFCPAEYVRDNTQLQLAMGRQAAHRLGDRPSLADYFEDFEIRRDAAYALEAERRRKAINAHAELRAQWWRLPIEPAIFWSGPPMRRRRDA